MNSTVISTSSGGQRTDTLHVRRFASNYSLYSNYSLLFSLRNDILGPIEEIPYWWRVTTQIRISRAAKKIFFNQSETLPRSE